MFEIYQVPSTSINTVGLSLCLFLFICFLQRKKNEQLFNRYVVIGNDLKSMDLASNGNGKKNSF
jgi:hypothetical protein